MRCEERLWKRGIATVNSLDEADRAYGGHLAGKAIFDPWRRCSIAK
jgi:hypothetical protein